MRRTRGGKIDSSSNSFANFTGSVRGETSGVVFDAILNQAPVAAVRLNPAVPAKLDEVINKALEIPAPTVASDVWMADNF